MKKIITLLILSLCSFTYSQSVSNMIMLGNANEYTAGGTPAGWYYASCWGYVTDGREYAIIGHYAGTTVYDITNSPGIVNKGTIPGPRKSCKERAMGDKIHS